MARVQRALLSCHDKTGLEVFAKGLAELGVELIASSGTAAFLQQHGLQPKTVEAFAGIAEQLDGRVKTLHPTIHAGILARRGDPAHVQAVGREHLIDVVAVNLYPFRQTAQRPGVTVPELLEQIDIGGVALLRAAAKNFPDVTVVCDPAHYPRLLDALRAQRGELPESIRRELAVAAFALTSEYDRWIAASLADGTGLPDHLPAALTRVVRQRQALRYGENPHQRSGWYVPLGESVQGLAALVKRQGKELTHNNLLDLDTAIRCVVEFERPSCVIVKHASPCGLASADTVLHAYQRAVEGDSESAFGGVVACNRALDRQTAAAMRPLFLDLIAAPAIEPEAQAALAHKTTLRLMEFGQLTRGEAMTEWRSIWGGWLAQDADQRGWEASNLRVVSARRPTDQELRDLAFAWIAAKHVKSNAIVLAKDEATVGIGQGQPSRVRAVRLAIQNAGPRSRGAVLASDGFFPFPDSVRLAAEAGVTAIAQPGGSVKDAEVIAAADAAKLSMVVTGVRHFRH